MTHRLKTAGLAGEREKRERQRQREAGRAMGESIVGKEMGVGYMSWEAVSRR